MEKARQMAGFSHLVGVSAFFDGQDLAAGGMDLISIGLTAYGDKYIEAYLSIGCFGDVGMDIGYFSGGCTHMVKHDLLGFFICEGLFLIAGCQQTEDYCHQHQDRKDSLCHNVYFLSMICYEL